MLTVVAGCCLNDKPVHSHCLPLLGATLGLVVVVVVVAETTALLPSSSPRLRCRRRAADPSPHRQQQQRGSSLRLLDDNNFAFRRRDDEMAMAARSPSSVGRRRCGRPLWWRSGLGKVALLSMLCLAVTAAISVVRAADDMTETTDDYQLEQQFVPVDGENAFEDKYGRRYTAVGGKVVVHGNTFNVYGQPVAPDSGIVTSNDVFVPVEPQGGKPKYEDDEEDTPDSFRGVPIETTAAAAAAPALLIPDPCGVEEKWSANNIGFGSDMKSDNINKFVGQVVEAVRRARTWRSRVPFTKDWGRRRKGEVCTHETADVKITDLASASTEPPAEPLAVQRRKQLELLNILRSSLEYRLSRFLSPAKRARCLFRFGKAMVLRWSWRCDKTTFFWKTLKKVNMCMGDRWKICYDHGQLTE